MTDQEAQEVVGLLAAGFINVTMEPRSAEVWVKLMAELENVECAALVAIDYARFSDKFPSFSDFRRSYMKKIKDRAEEPRRQERAALEAGPKLEEPPWVSMWRALRAAGDQRVFRQQERGYRSLGYEWPADDEVIEAAEVAAWVRSRG